MPVDTNTAPNLLDKAKRVWIKDGRRRIMTDSGYMLMPHGVGKMMFGKMRGGKYSVRQ